MLQKTKQWDDLKTRGPQLRALCIGNNYNTKDNAVFGALKNCTKDAEAVAQKVRDLFGQEAVTLKRNIKHRAQLEKELRDFLLKIDRPPRMVIIYFSGHGVQEGDQIFLVPNDASPSNLEELREQCLSHDDLFRILKQDLEDREVVGDALSCVVKSPVLSACCLN